MLESLRDLERSNLDPSVVGATEKMVQRLASKQYGNWQTEQYLKGTNALKDLGISIPPQMKSLDIALGWPEAVVSGITQRIRYNGIYAPGTMLDDSGIDEIFTATRMTSRVPQLVRSSVGYSTAFASVSLGNQAAGEPPVVIETYDSREATGLWNPRTQRLGAALLVTSRDDAGTPNGYSAIFPHLAIHATNSRTGWRFEVQPNRLGYVPVFDLSYQKQLDRPFGQSAVSRPVKYNTDAAARVILRSELQAEMFSSPSRWLLNAPEDLFEPDEDGNEMNPWNFQLGRLLSIPYNAEDEQSPEIGQFAAHSPTPHIEHLRMYAGIVSGSTGIPFAELGVSSSDGQPTSEGSFEKSREKLILTAEQAISDFSDPLRDIAICVYHLANQTTETPAELKKGLHSSWQDPSFPTTAQSVDAAMKLSASGILPSTSDVLLEKAGLNQTEIARIKAERQQASALDLIQGLDPASPEATSSTEEATVLKAKFDALGVAVRAGVNPEDAARRLGLEGIEFTGAVPSMLRMPEKDAAVLED